MSESVEFANTEKEKVYKWPTLMLKPGTRSKIRD